MNKCVLTVLLTYNILAIMSTNLNEIDKIKFQSRLSLGEHSPKVNKTILAVNADLAVTFSVTTSFFQELSSAKLEYPDFSYIDIVNSQIEAIQLKFSERLENRFYSKTAKVLSLCKKLRGRKRIEFDDTLHKIAIFSNELENVKDLNFSLQKFQRDNMELEQKCSDLHKILKEEITFKNSLIDKTENLSDQLENLKIKNGQLFTYVKSMNKKIGTSNSGKPLADISEANKARKINEFKSKAETALWFAESYGLTPSYLKLQSSNGKDIKIDFKATSSSSSYQQLPNDEKQKIKDLLFILEKFNVSESAYRELTMFSDDLPRKYLIAQCRDDINNIFHFERTSGNIPGAFMSLESEIARYIKCNFDDEVDKIRVKVSGDGSKVSRISNFIVLSFSVITDNLTLSSNDQVVFCIVNCKEDYSHLKQSCAPVFHEINKLYERGNIDVDGKSVEVEILMGGDMKFLQTVLGLGGSLCNYSCPWCRIHKNQREDLSKPWDHYHTVMPRTVKNLEEDVLKNDYGVRAQSLLKLEPKHIVIDELHLLLRICDKLLSNLIIDAKTLDDRNAVQGNKSDILNQLVNKIRDCGVSFYVWTKKGTQGELDWSSLTGSEYKKLLEHLPSKLCFLIHHNTHNQTVHIWDSFLKLYRFMTLEVHEFSDPEVTFQKCKLWVENYLSLGSSGRKGYDSVTPYMHCLVYHVPYFTKTYGKLIRFSGQGVEKINDDVKKIHHSKTNKWDATLDALQVRKRVEHLASENCEREKRTYHKKSDVYWHDTIFQQRSAKKAKICEEMSKAAEKYAENVVTCTTDSLDDLSLADIKNKLKSLGIKTRLKNKDKLLALLKSKL